MRGWPISLQVSQVNSTANNLTWNEVICSQRNGPITDYTVMISNSSITYNFNSTERYVILNDLVIGTVYNISVAAVNTVGRGPFSVPIVLEVGRGMYYMQRPSSSYTCGKALMSYQIIAYHKWLIILSKSRAFVVKHEPDTKSTKSC